jgi:hypothetical protein
MNVYNYSFLMMTALLISCRSERHQSDDSIFPLTPAREVTLVKGEYALTVRVVEPIEVQGMEFYRVEETSRLGGGPSVTRTLFLSRTCDGTIVRTPTSEGLPETKSRSFIWYKCDTAVGSSWEVIANAWSDQRRIDNFRITLLSVSDTVRTPAGVFTRCCRFHIDDLNEMDTDYYDWLAPGIGIVRRQFAADTTSGFLLKSTPRG